MTRRITLAAMAALIVVLPRPGRAGDLKVENVWVRGVPPSIGDSAAFMKLENTTDQPIKIVSGTASFAGMAMLMQTTHKTVNGVDVAGMAAIDSIEIPPHTVHMLEPGGDHLMLMNLKSHPILGDKVKVTLQFEPGHRTVTVDAEVRLDAD